MKAITVALVIGIGGVIVSTAGSVQAAGRETIIGYGPYPFGMPLSTIRGHAQCHPDTLAIKPSVPTVVCDTTIRVRVGLASWNVFPAKLRLEFIEGRLVRLFLTTHNRPPDLQHPYEGNAQSLWEAIANQIRTTYSPRLVVTDSPGFPLATLDLKDAAGAEIYLGQDGDEVRMTYASSEVKHAEEGF
jgi:hypothetical protein